MFFRFPAWPRLITVKLNETEFSHVMLEVAQRLEHFIKLGARTCLEFIFAQQNYERNQW